MSITFTAAILVALLLLGCSGGASSGEGSSGSSPLYSADEPFNDSFQTTELIVAEAEKFVVEGYIHHGDLDCMVVAPVTPIAGRMVEVTFDYAFGWDMDASLGYRTATGELRTLWAGFDEAGQVSFGTLRETFPADAVDITLSIGQRTLTHWPGSTRYTIDIEVF